MAPKGHNISYERIEVAGVAEVGEEMGPKAKAGEPSAEREGAGKGKTVLKIGSQKFRKDNQSAAAETQKENSPVENPKNQNRSPAKIATGKSERGEI